MNILIISNMYLPHVGGVEMVVKNLADEFTKMGNQVSIISSRTSRSLKIKEIVNGIEVTRTYLGFPNRSLKSLIVFLIYFLPSLLHLRTVVKEKKPDIVNFHFVDSTGLYIILLKKWFDFPLVVSIHGNDIHKLPVNSQLQKKILVSVLKMANLVTSCSASLLRDAASLVPEILDKSVVTYNGIREEEFSISKAYDSEAPYIFALGRFEYKKGFDVLLRAFSLLAPRYPYLSLFIGGAGEEEKHLRKLIDELNLGEKVKLLGLLDRKKVVSFFKGCEFFVLPSRIEPLGIVNLEAMAAGKAIVATKVDGVPEIVKDGENGILVKPEDPDMLAKAMMRLLDDLELRKKIESKNIQAVRERYTWKKITESYLAAYQRAVG